MELQYQIKGTVMPVLEVTLRSGESIYSEAGAMSWMTDDVEMRTDTRGTGFSGMFGRALMGESMFLTTYTCTAKKGRVTFASPTPGHVIATLLKPGQHIIAQRGGFLAAVPSVTLQMSWKKLSTGFFGGEGFILQKITGPGMVFTAFDGEIMEECLGPGETLKVDPGHIAMFEPSVSYSITQVKGLGNIFCAEGLFLATLTGPGRVWLQTMPLSNLAKAIRPFIPKS